MSRPTYDVLVVGGGILGAFHAYHAAKKGKRVALFEKDTQSSGSTVQNFGQVVPSGLKSPWFEYGLRTLEIYQELQQKGDFTLRQQGSIYLASDEAEWQVAQELSDRHLEKNYDNILLTPRGVQDRYPFLQPTYAVGGLFYPRDMSVEPTIFIHRFLHYLKEQLKVDVFFGQAIVDCQESSIGVQVKSANHQIWRAAKVIICSGYVFNVLFADLYAQSGLIVSKLQMMQTLPMPDLQMKGNMLTGLTIRRYESFEECPSFQQFKVSDSYRDLLDWGIHILFKQAQDGSILIGDSHEYSPVAQAQALDQVSRETINELILQEAARIVQFPVRTIEKRWAGFYAQHPDDLFEYNVSDNIHIRTGIGGKGMSSSAGYAEKSIADLLGGRG